MEKRAVVSMNVAPMRCRPDSGAEMVSQAIFGETVSVRGSDGEYSEIVTPDGYPGWVLTSQLSSLDRHEHYPDPKRAAMVTSLIQPLFHEPGARSERLTLLTIGTVVEIASESAGDGYCSIRMPGGGVGYLDSTALIVPEYPPLEHLGPNVVLVGRGMIGTPYLWGGRTTFGIDCSGYTQRVYWLCGRALPRDAYQQAECPVLRPVDRSELKPGDLVFFRSERNPRNRSVTHVGIAMGDGRFLHASGALGVAATPLNHPQYDREFVFARRFEC